MDVQARFILGADSHFIIGYLGIGINISHHLYACNIPLVIFGFICDYLRITAAVSLAKIVYRYCHPIRVISLYVSFRH